MNLSTKKKIVHAQEELASCGWALIEEMCIDGADEKSLELCDDLIEIVDSLTKLIGKMIKVN